MAAPKRSTHEVVHPNLFLSVDGKLQRVPKGTPLVLTEKQAALYRGKVRSLREIDPVDVSGDGE